MYSDCLDGLLSTDIDLLMMTTLLKLGNLTQHSVRTDGRVARNLFRME